MAKWKKKVKRESRGKYFLKYYRKKSNFLNIKELLHVHEKTMN